MSYRPVVSMLMVLLVTSSIAAAPPSYRVSKADIKPPHLPTFEIINPDLDIVPFFKSLAEDNTVFGSVDLPDGRHVPALFADGVVTPLDVIGGNLYSGNGQGSAVGDLFTEGTRPSALPFELTADGEILPYPVPEGTLSASAIGLTDSGLGLCVFTFLDANNVTVQRVAFCNAEGFRLLADLGLGGFPWAVNPSGTAAIGVSASAEGRLDTLTIWPEDTDEPLFFGRGVGYRINDQGRWVGQANALPVTGTLTEGPTPLPILETCTSGAAYGLNAKGDAVGQCTEPFEPSGRFVQQALFWDKQGHLTDLNSRIDPDSGWHLSVAVSINDRGVILARGLHPDEEGPQTLLLIPSAKKVAKR